MRVLSPLSCTVPPSCSGGVSCCSEGTALDYLQKKAQTIKNDYKTPDGQCAESCAIIAFDIGDLLLKAGQYPSIIEYSEKDIKGRIISSKPLAPLLYEGRVTWYCHVVCQSDGLIYDPILGEPISVCEYSMRVFGKEIASTVLWYTSELQEMLEREQARLSRCTTNSLAYNCLL